MPKIAFLTSGGIAPCLSASIGALIGSYKEIAPDAEFIGYRNGYQGLLLGRFVEFPRSAIEKHELFYRYGGSPIGNSRVKLTNVENCVKRGLVKEGESPLEVAANQLKKDGVDILHTIGGDDTNSTAADLAAYLKENGYDLTVVGLPKTVDNDVYPIRQTLGAWTAAEEGAKFFRNIANENTTSARQLIIHEVMGRHCGWLTAATAREYREMLEAWDFIPELHVLHEVWDIDAIWIPEMDIDFDAECERLLARMDKHDSIQIFLSEGAGIDTIVHEMEAAGQKVARDAFGHVRLDELNPGQWFANQLKGRLAAEKVLVQKSGYFARSAPPNERDLELIKACCNLAAEAGLRGESGVAGQDMDHGDELRIIEFSRIKGGKPFDIDEPWFVEMLEAIGQPKGKKIAAH